MAFGCDMFLALGVRVMQILHHVYEFIPSSTKTTPVTSKPSEAALPPGAAVVHGTEAQSGGMGTGCLCFGSERPCHGEDVAMKYHEGICMLQRQLGYPQVIVAGGN